MKRKINILPIIIFAVLFFLINSYVMDGISTLNLSRYFNQIFGGLVILIAGSLMYALQRIQSKGMDGFFKISTHAFLMLFVSELVFVFILLLGDVYRLALGLFSFAGMHHAFLIPARNVFWAELGALLFVLSLFLFLYGITRGKYAYRVIRHTLFFKDLPESFDGFTIAQISDVHAGSFNNAGAVQKGIDLINAQKADLFVFTGDLVNNKADEIRPWLDHFSKIKAPFGQFSILGNHDYGDYIKWENGLQKSENLKQLKRYHTELGYRLLLDEHVEIHKDGEKIILAGVENWGVGFGERGDLKKALSGVGEVEFKILLSHDPSHWDAEVKENPSKIHLTLSGHTHGMQFGLEAFGIKWSPVKYRYKHWAGIKMENGRYLNINRGFGFLGFSGRIGIWPEITIIKLKRA